MHVTAKTPTTFQELVPPKDSRLAGYAALVHALSVKASVRRPSCIYARLNDDEVAALEGVIREAFEGFEESGIVNVS
jgi:hypothetical protein